jgi:NitT/TauT family transport system ATP-binding protein
VLVGSRVLVLSPHPGRVRAELDASQLDYNSVDKPEFGAMTKRIHDLLFAEPQGGAAKKASASI